PYTQSDVDNLVVSSPRVLTSPSAAVLDWPTSLTNILLNYRSLEYEYTDKSGTKITGKQVNNPRIFAANLNAGQPLNMLLKYNVIPKVNGVAILDSVQLNTPFTINMPTGSSTFNPAEREILEANGITTFTADAVASYKKLTFPVHTNTLQDLFYFANVRSEERRVGKECRSRWWRYHEKKKKLENVVLLNRIYWNILVRKWDNCFCLRASYWIQLHRGMSLIHEYRCNWSLLSTLWCEYHL